MGIRVVEPFPAEAWPRVWDWCQGFWHRVADDFAPRSRDAFVREQIEQARRQRTWGVYRGADLGGLVTFEAGTGGVGTSHALFRRDFWGEAPIEALREIYGQIFSSGVRKIVGTPFRDNLAIRAVAMKLGAKCEGVLREQTLRGGKPADLAVLGLLKGDFERCQLGG